MIIAHKPVRQKIIDRYESDADGRVVIDVAVARIEELYDRFDSSATYRKKDLDEDFAQYLINCVREIKHTPFAIRINLPEQEEPPREARVRASIRHYFQYLQESEKREIRKHLSRACFFLSFGVLLVFLSLSLASRYRDVASIMKELGIEGVTIVAWVSMWEAASNLIFEWVPHFNRHKVYQRIIDSEVLFRPQPPAPTDDGGE